MTDIVKKQGSLAADAVALVFVLCVLQRKAQVNRKFIHVSALLSTNHWYTFQVPLNACPTDRGGLRPVRYR